MKFKLILIILLSNFNLAGGAEKIADQNTIHKNLRCLVCQGQSIADSNSDFAQTIKLVVKDLITLLWLINTENGLYLNLK